MLVSLFRNKTARTPIRRRPKSWLSPRLGLENLEDRAVPAVFSFAGFSFEQDQTPTESSLIPVGTVGGAIITDIPTGTSGLAGFPDAPTTGFDPMLTVGNPYSAGPSNQLFALNLPEANDGTAARSGVELGYAGNLRLGNQAGDDIVIYESGSNSMAPEGFMVRVRNATTGAYTGWYYFAADSFSVYDTTPATVTGGFATAFDFSDLGIPADGYVDRFQIVNLTDEDRTLLPTGQGLVIPEDNGTTSSNLPDPGPLAGFSTYPAARSTRTLSTSE